MRTAIGVDIGGTKLLAVRVEDGVVADEYKTAKPNRGDVMVADIVAAVEMLAAGHGVAACGIGIAGLVDAAAGVFVWGPHVDGTNIAVRAEVAAVLDMPVSVDNDANTTAYAEYMRGAGRGSAAMLMLTLGTGIGGAMLFDGSIYRGRGFAGEFGHTDLGSSTELCVCGQRGCWETAAAGPALERLARELVASDPGGSLDAALGGRAPTGPAISAAAAAGDPQAIALITQVGRAFGRGLASLLSMLDPDRVVIGGGLGSIGGVLLESIRHSAQEARYAAGHKKLPPIVAAELGEQAGAIGAALLALDEAGQ